MLMSVGYLFTCNLKDAVERECHTHMYWCAQQTFSHMCSEQCAQ